MITFNELLNKNSIGDVPHSALLRLEVLLASVQKIRAEWGKPMHVTSGFRTLQKHLDIYRAKGIKDKNIPRGSAHLTGEAVDFLDTDAQLYNWLRFDQHGIATMEAAGLYGELDTKGWIHLQTRKPGSGNRWFKA